MHKFITQQKINNNTQNIVAGNYQNNLLLFEMAHSTVITKHVLISLHNYSVHTCTFVVTGFPQ